MHEPVHRFRTEAPADTLGALLPAPAALRPVPRTTRTHGPLRALEGEAPAARVHTPEQRLTGLTRGEGEPESAFDHDAPVRGDTVREGRAPATTPRTARSAC
ncbi:hypothetical protein [Streptomyces sp. NRRL S-340]|uniref:hypothetical protein n=1 Tax=Streptomyces sp. NRRL S-340 TaxID=1463901 RepID=UPI00055B5DA4